MAASDSKDLKIKFNNLSEENLPSLGKESLRYYCKELGLKVTREKQELVNRLALLWTKLFEKKVFRLNQTFKLSTSLNASEIHS